MSEPTPLPPLCVSAFGALVLLTVAGVVPWLWGFAILTVTLLLHRLPGWLPTPPQLPVRELGQGIVDPVKPHTRP